MDYELQRHEHDPHSPRELLQNNPAYTRMRWKGIAVSNDINALRKACLRPKECRIINRNTLEVFEC